MDKKHDFVMCPHCGYCIKFSDIVSRNNVANISCGNCYKSPRVAWHIGDENNIFVCVLKTQDVMGWLNHITYSDSRTNDVVVRVALPALGEISRGTKVDVSRGFIGYNEFSEVVRAETLYLKNAVSAQLVEWTKKRKIKRRSML